ncbi:MAG: flagellar hook-basal body complex protein, partial [Brevundimonas sp.]|uniref:flagellar hook-basal body complex protein n=1 Tax=Brevundimonas sp. TaxID=1871086 RepID=UPI002732A2F1
MSINSALLAGVSGLSANSAALAAISQNIANVNTVGYKRTSAEFSTIVNGQNSGAGYSAGGVLANTRNFIAQAGQLQRTTSSTDLGIAGQGFFVTTEKAEGLDAGDARLFTRAGAFRVDDFGYLKNTAGLYLQGWPVDSEGGITTDPSDLGRLRSINVGSVGGTAEPTTRAQLNANLRSSQLPSQFVAPAIKNAVLDNTAPTPVSHNYTVDYARTGANSWDVTVREPSTNTTFTGNVTYDATSGALLTSTLPGASLTTLQIAAGPPVLTVPLASLGLNTSAEVLERYDVNTNSMSMYDIENDTGFKPDFQITVPVSDSKGGQRNIAYSFLKTE